MRREVRCTRRPKRRAEKRIRVQAGVMFFLVRVAFWLTVVLVLLPSGSSQKGAQAAKFGTTDAVVAAGAAVSDRSNFGEPQPAAGEVGAQAAVAIGQRAQAGAMMVYEFINER